MSLPALVAPVGVPLFLAAGHGVELRDVYSEFAMLRGHPRKRRVSTAELRVVSVEWFLITEHARLVDLWFENTLRVGEREFSALVANIGPGQLWWAARWLEPYDTTPIASPNGIIWKLTGRLLLSGDGQIESPLAGDAAIEVIFELLGDAVIEPNGDAALEVTFPLEQAAPAAIEVVFELLGRDTGFELRQDAAAVSDGYELREDSSAVADGIELRE